MTGAHFHLMVNHLPLFSILFGTLALVWFLWKKTPEMVLAAALLFGLGSVSAILAIQSGEPAEEMIEEHPEVVKSMIHEHEEAGELAFALALALGAGGAALVALKKYRPQYLNQAAWGVLVLAVVSNVAMGRAALYGGPIRHTEIREGGDGAYQRGGSMDQDDESEDEEDDVENLDQEFYEEELIDETSDSGNQEKSSEPTK